MKEIQIKIILKFYITPIRMADMKKIKQYEVLVRMERRKWTPPTLMVGMKIIADMMEIRMEIKNLKLEYYMILLYYSCLYTPMDQSQHVIGIGAHAYFFQH